MIRPPPTSPRFPYTTLFRSAAGIPCVTLHPPLDDARSPEEAAEQFALNCRFYERASERARAAGTKLATHSPWPPRSEEHTSELQSRQYLVCRLLLEKKKN